MQNLGVTVNEKSTLALDVVLYDEDDAVVTPQTINWTLLNGEGAIVNSRNEVVLTPATSHTITLSGDDLAIAVSGKSPHKRILLLKATYNSTLGSNLPAYEEASFEIINLTGVT